MDTKALTLRELEVMNLLIQGYTNPQISDKLSIARNTTKAHISSIYEKLGVENRVQAVVKYFEENLKNRDKQN